MQIRRALIAPGTWRRRSRAARAHDCQSVGLKGQRIGIDGLASTITDALVRIAFADGTTWTQRLTPQRPSVIIPSATIAMGVSTI